EGAARRLVGEPLLQHYPLPHSRGTAPALEALPRSRDGPPASAPHEAACVGTTGGVEEGGTAGTTGIGGRGSSSAILSISSCWGTGTGYAPSKQARQNWSIVPWPTALMRPGIAQYAKSAAPRNSPT